MLQAMNTGHDGSLTTTHANSPREAINRLEVLALMSGLDLPARAIREQIANSVHLVVQQSRFSDGSRRVTSIAEVRGPVPTARSSASTAPRAISPPSSTTSSCRASSPTATSSEAAAWAHTHPPT
jgi:Flp pilus assembly CpaF family ATPase